ncbi:MAG: hypothetical protein K1W31_17490 [Lachnospiraceae bacterium]
MKIMIITVAGIASRFSQSLGQPCLKCLYHKTDIKESLLYHMIYQNPEVDKYIIVGGFKYNALKKAIDLYFGELHERIVLLKNERFEEYGSGYSLYLGLKAAADMDYDELVFAEGDLWVDDKSFRRIWEAQDNVLTCNHEAILADKSVAFYYDGEYGIHFIFDTSHSMLEIREPFLGIFNSGQIWKFTDKARVVEVMMRLSPKEWEKTNLGFIQEYFGSLTRSEYEIIALQSWINCNTVEDFEDIEKMEENYENGR